MRRMQAMELQDEEGRRRALSGTRAALTTSSAIAVLLALFLAGGAVTYQAYLASPDIPEATPAAPTRAPIARRVVMFIIDGFHPGDAWNPVVMPTFARLAGEGASGIAKTSSMSLTAPCVFSLGTGRPGTLLQAILDFHAPETRVESLPSLVAAAGGRVVMSSDQSWHQQFGWTAKPEDLHVVPEGGVTGNVDVVRNDHTAIEILIAKLAEPDVRLAITHLHSVDAVGHMVTPSGARYREVLHETDGMLASVVEALGPDTVLLVTGDHGMGPRGTHSGRDDEATLTPYLLHGPGVRRGVRADVRQTALPTTLAALAGLPLPQAAEHPPLVDLLDIAPAAARALEAAYLERKVAAAKTLAPDLTVDTGAELRVIDAQLNRILFGEGDRRLGLRLLAIAATLVGILGALAFTWCSVPWSALRPLFLPCVGAALVLPVGLFMVGWVLITWRSLVPFQSWSMAAVLAVLAFAGIGGLGLAVARAPRLRDGLARWQVPSFFGLMVALAAPLANSRWLAPQPIFEGLLIALALGVALRAHRRVGRVTRSVALVPAFVVLAHAEGWLSMALRHDWTYVLPLSAAVLGLGLVHVRGGGWTMRAKVSAVLVASAFLAAWTWRMQGGFATAWVVLGLSLAAIAAAPWARVEPRAAAALMIGGASALFLMMAETGAESFVFLLAAVAALVLSRHRLPLERPEVLYAAAGLAFLVRMCLFFQLGDYYSINSIRTAPGFRVVESGLPLATVTTLLLLKYALPWLLIFGAALPSLVSAGRAVTRHAIDALTIAYVARFAVVAALVDPFHVLPNGMEGLVSVFSISWAELITFAAAASLTVMVTYRSPIVEPADAEVAPARDPAALPRTVSA